jgi:hypothetical protein
MMPLYDSLLFFAHKLWLHFHVQWQVCVHTFCENIQILVKIFASSCIRYCGRYRRNIMESLFVRAPISRHAKAPFR